jgi:hypothetical protein
MSATGAGSPVVGIDAALLGDSGTSRRQVGGRPIMV